MQKQKWPGERRLAPGVVGSGYENQGAFILESVEAECQGDGAVGRYIDGLKAKYHTVIVVVVISPRLAGMLSRRGFEDAGGPWEGCWVWRSPLAPALPAKSM